MNSIDENWVEKHIDSDGTIIIPDGIEKIEAEAFLNNIMIKKVVMPDTILEIGDEAFNGCSNLKEVKFGNNVRNIGKGAFFVCESLKSVELPKSIEQIGYMAFAGCEKLETISIDYEAKVKEIKNSTFQNCKGLKTITLPHMVEKIGEMAFMKCESLMQIKNPDTLKIIEKGAFYGCYSLSSVDLGKGVETIGDSAFCNCKKLESITFPDSLKKLDVCSFADCRSLTYINGGQNIEEIEVGAFSETNIRTFNVPPRVKMMVPLVLQRCTNLTELYLGENTEGIEVQALVGCSNLKKIVINKNLGYFAESALKGVNSLEEIEINGTPKINYNTFKGKKSIRKITVDGRGYLLNENEELYTLQKHNSKFAIVVKDKEDSIIRTRYTNLEEGTETKRNVNIYLANDGSGVISINSTASLSLKELKELKQMGLKQMYISGATRDTKPSDYKDRREYDLYTIDELIQIKEAMQEIKNGIIIPPHEDKHREKKIYSQLVRRLSEKIEYDFYEQYYNATKEDKEECKAYYEKITGKSWDEYFNKNKDKDIKKMMIEDGNLIGFLNGCTVCRGNVEIIRNLAAELGIEADVIIGRGHAWNQVKLDGAWYDDDFTNYQPHLVRGNIERAIQQFLCGQIKGQSIFSKLTMYSNTIQQVHTVGNCFSSSDKIFLLNYGRSEQQKREEEAEWMNIVGSVAQEVDKTIEGAKKKEEFAKLTKNIKEQEKNERTKTQEEQG